MTIQGRRIQNVRPGNTIVLMDPPGDGQIYSANFAKMPGHIKVREIDLGTCKNHVHVNGNACYDWDLPIAILLETSEGGPIPEDMITTEDARAEIDMAIRTHVQAERVRQFLGGVLNMAAQMTDAINEESDEEESAESGAEEERVRVDG